MAAASTAGRDFYWYTFAPSSTFAAGAQTGAIGAGTVCNSDCSIRNYAVTLISDAFKVGFDVVPSIAKPDAATASGTIGVYKPYATSFVTAPVPLNTYLNVQLILSYSSLAASYATTAPTTAIFSAFPLASNPITAVATGTTTALTFTLANLLSDQRTSGVYDLAIPAGTLVNAAGTAWNAELRIRMIVGMPAVIWDPAFSAPATLRSANQTTAVYVTNAKSVIVQQHSGITGDLASTVFSDLYEKVFKNNNQTAISTTGGGSFIPGAVTGLIGGMSGIPLTGTTDGVADLATAVTAGASAPFYALYRLDVSGLSDGTDYYTFIRKLNGGGNAAFKNLLDKSTAPQVSEWVRPNLAIIIDRTAPVGSPVRFTGAVPYIGATGTVTLPTTLFSDTVSSPNQIKITSVAADDMHGFALVPGVQGSAQLVAASPVIGPAGDVVFTVTGQDEAGNTATAKLTVTLYSKPKPALTVADSRSVFTSTLLKTGAAQLAVSGNLVLTVIATYPEAVTGITSADLTVTKPWGADATVTTPVSSANGRVWTFSVTIPGASAATARDGDVWRLFMAEDAGTTTAKSLATAQSDTVRVIIDSAGPSGPSTATISSFTAVVGIPFFAPVPMGLFVDSAGGKPSTANPYATLTDNLDLTVGTPDVSVGLTFTAGKQGASYISGTASTAPINGYVDFTITARDEAGNVNSALSPVKLRVIIASQATAGYSPVSGVAKPPTLTFDASTAAFRDGGAAVTLSSAASWASVDQLTSTARNVDAVYVYMTTLDRDAGPTPSEKVSGTVPDNTLEVLSSMSRFGNALIDVEVLRPAAAAAAAPIPAADVTSYLRSLQYTNANSAPTSGSRTVHVVVTRGQFVVGYATKKVSVTSLNAVPALSGAGGTASYLESTGRGATLATAIVIADSDDSAMTKATFQITTTNVNTYAACDPARDYLYLPGNYMEPASPKVEGAWDTSTCTLTLAPSSGVASLSVPEFQAAMRAVKYRNLDAQDPTNGVTSGAALARMVQIRVTDAASGGLTSATETSVTGTYAYVAFTLVDDAPAVNLVNAYAEGGLLYDADPNSNWKVVVISSNKYRTRKFSLAVDPTLSVSTTYYISMDLRKLTDRYFGGAAGLAAIYDPDTKEPLAAGTSITLVATGAPTGVTVASNLGGADNSGVSYYITSASAPAQTLSRIPVTIANPSTQAGGEFKVTLTYGTAAPVDFWVDVRIKGCILARNGGSAVNLNEVYPDQTKCAAALAADTVLNHDVAVASGYTAATADYATLSTAAKTKADALLQAGTKLADAVAAAAAERSAARGVYAVTILPNAFSTADGTIALKALPMDTTARTLVPAPKTGETVDKDVSLKLGPACTTFSKPVKICIHVGDTNINTNTRNLRFASQFDCSDASKGYSAMEPATEQTYNPISGELCGYTSHFSLAIVVVAPVLASATIPKTVNMGGSCPNDCSGKGYCRAEGKCVCFQGYTGYDCSQRACPVAQSWDTASNVVHRQTECANRGICDRSSGKCQCFDGYTGSSCERAACPASCSGHGRCLLLGELADVQASGYSSWEQSRYQVCQCDGGYTGADCSQRTCPYGDDPETTCSASKKQVQSVTVDFGTIPTSLSGSLPASLYDTDEIVLVYAGPDGTNYTTNAIKDVFDASTTGAAALKNALVSLPNFAIDSVSTSGSGSSTSPKVVYKVTFDAPLTSATAPRLQVANNRLPGNHALLQCVANIDGSMGCTTAGCRPLYKQTRLYEFVPSGTGVSLNSASLFSQPAAIAAGNTAGTAGQWGVEVYVAIKTDGFGKYTYEVTSDVYGTGGGATIAQTPLPPGALRKGVPLVYGLTVDFDSDASIVPTAGRGAKFAWRLPTCTVAQDQAADADYESKECGNRGACDRGTGVCKCYAGYSGYSCR